MELLVVLWLLFLFGGRIITALARSKERKSSTPVDRHQVELGQLQPTHSTQSIDETFIEKSKRESEARTKIRNAATLQSRANKHHNEGAGSQKNQSARMQQEQYQKLQKQSKRGKFAGSVKDYIESMSGSFGDEVYQASDAELKRTKRRNLPKEQTDVYEMSTGTTEDIDWDNYEPDFTVDSEWADDEEEMDGISQILQAREQAAKVEETPLVISQLAQTNPWKQAIITSEILAKPKAARRR